jgi:hypothetical protein
MRKLACLLFAAVALAFADTPDDARALYDDAQRYIREGRFDTARCVLETLISVYPESPLAAQAQNAIRASYQAEKRQSVLLTVRNIHWRHLGITTDEIRRQFDAHEVALAKGRVYDPRDVEQARAALADILAGKGASGAAIKTEARAVRPHRVDIVFSLVKSKEKQADSL